jgi:NtrC-family two-component system response regulator AlgB
MVLNILIVDDEPNIRKTLAYCLVGEGHTVISVSNSADALEEARRKVFDIVFLDLRLGEENGMELIAVLLADSPWIKIVVITAHASIETAVEAMKKGAADYIAKPFTPDQVRLITHRTGKIRKLETQIAALKDNTESFAPENRVQSKSPGMQNVIETARKAAASEAIILLRGESGTGKSEFSKAIHKWSPRSEKPMAVVSCPAVPSELLESELFGHTKGAFTGSVRDNPGRIAYCEGGTLLLDEIGEMALTVQAKLLRFIQDKEYERLGDSTPRKADVRIIAATNADLEKLVEEGKFREDLFYRLNVINITIPPLRERKEDILSIAAEFLVNFCKINHKKFLGFTNDAEKSLLAYAWPGNVRELRNTIERAVILASTPKIGVNDLSFNISQAEGTPAIGDPVPIAAIEELHIRRILASTSSLQEAAETLGIDQATLWRRRKKYNI